MDLTEAISLMKVNLDKFLIETIDIVRKNNVITTKDTKDVIDITPELTETLKDWTDWMKVTFRLYKHCHPSYLKLSMPF